MRLRDTTEAHFTGVWAAEKQKHRVRRRLNMKHRARDKRPNRCTPGSRRYTISDMGVRQHIPTETGYGVAYRWFWPWNE